MSQLVRVSGDYGIKVDDGSTITLDTGLEVGKVLITGELIVRGPTTSVETTNLSITDNVILLNKGEEGAGITKITSGIEIDRGTLPQARLFFDESISWYNPLTDTTDLGSWIFVDEDAKLQPLRVAALSSNAVTDFVIDLRNGPGVLKLVNTDSQAYSDSILDDLPNSDNKIPTTRTLRDYVTAGIVTPGVADVDKIYFSSDGGLTISSRVQSYSSNIDFYINESFAAQITAGGLDVFGDVNIRGANLVTATSTFNLINTNATTINFGGSANSIIIGSTLGSTRFRHSVDVDGDINIDGGDLTVTTGIFNLANTNALTVNFAGTATSVNIGASIGVTNVNHNLNIRGTTLSTDSTTFDFVNTNATTVNFAGAATDIQIGAATGTTNVNNNLTVDLDLAVNGGDLTTTSTTFNLLNTNAITVNFAGAATDIQIGSSTGITNINNDLDVDGDVNIDGGDLTVSTATFNLANTTATTVNFAGAATDIQIGAATGTTTVNNNLTVDLDLAVNGGDLTTTATTFNLVNTDATTVNFAGAASVIEIGTANGSTTINDINITGNVISSVSADDLFFDGVLALANQLSVPAVESGYVKLYSVDIPGTGGTGLYFVNTIGTNDELISKTKALLYSLIL